MVGGSRANAIAAVLERGWRGSGGKLCRVFVGSVTVCFFYDFYLRISSIVQSPVRLPVSSVYPVVHAC